MGLCSNLPEKFALKKNANSLKRRKIWINHVVFLAQFKEEKLNRFGRNIMKMIVKKDYQNGILLPGRRPGNNASIELISKIFKDPE